MGSDQAGLSGMNVLLQLKRKAPQASATSPSPDATRNVLEPAMDGQPEVHSTIAPARDDGKWLLAAEKALGFLQETKPRIIGIAGDRAGAGCSSFARALAKAYKLLGKRVLYVDASRKTQASRGEAGRAAEFVRPLDLLANIGVNEGLQCVDMRDTELARMDAKAFRTACEAALQSFDILVVDLQPIAESLAAMDPGARATGPACDAVLLVCLTERATEAELEMRLQVSRLQDFKLAGIVLNDWGVRFGGLMGNGAKLV